MRAKNIKISLIAIIIVLVISISISLFSCGKKTKEPQVLKPSIGDQVIQEPQETEEVDEPALPEDEATLPEDEAKFDNFIKNGPSVTEEEIESWFKYSDEDTKLKIIGLTDKGEEQQVLYFPNKDGVKLDETISMSKSQAKEIYINSKLNFNQNYLNYVIDDPSLNRLEEVYVDRDENSIFYHSCRITLRAINLKKIIIRNANYIKIERQSLFGASPQIESIKFLGKSDNIYQEDGNVFIKKIEDGVEEYRLFAATKDAKNINSKITHILANAFDKFTTLDEVIVISENVKEIYSSVFRNSNIKEVIIPESVKKLGAGNFLKCTNLTKITVAWKEGERPKGWYDGWANDIPSTCQIIYAE